MAILTESGKLYTCGTGFDGYASGLGQGHEDRHLGRVVQSAEDALIPGLVGGALLGRGLHSSTLQLNLSAFRVTGVAVQGLCRGCSGGGRGY